jgi:hypothetical protein
VVARDLLIFRSIVGIVAITPRKFIGRVRPSQSQY